MTQFSQRLRLDLADTLSCYIEFLADLFQRAGAAVIHTESETEHFLLSLCQRIQHLVKLLLQKCLGSRLSRYRNIVILDKVSQMAVLLLANRCLKRYRRSLPEAALVPVPGEAVSTHGSIC